MGAPVILRGQAGPVGGGLEPRARRAAGGSVRGTVGPWVACRCMCGAGGSCVGGGGGIEVPGPYGAEAA